MVTPGKKFQSPVMKGMKGDVGKGPKPGSKGGKFHSPAEVSNAPESKMHANSPKQS